MKSHEYAEKIKRAAEYLLGRPEFEVETHEAWLYLGSWWTNKESFLKAVKAIGPGVKRYGSNEMTYAVTVGARMDMSIQRSAVCTKVQDEKWECEPLLAPEEEAAIGALIPDEEIPF